MTKEDWEYVEEVLKNPFEFVTLQCDEYKLELCLRRISTYKMAIFFYVNGQFKGNWWFNDCEERRRFFKRTERSILTREGKKKFKKMSKKKQAELHDKYFFKGYTPYWTSFRSLKKHLIENNESIELIGLR